MTVEANLYTALRALVADRVYPDVAPAGSVTPYITYQQVGGDSVVFLDSTLPDKRNGRFQINVWAPTRKVASDLMRQIAGLVVASTTLRAQPMGEPVAGYEEETRLYGARQFFSIWFVA